MSRETAEMMKTAQRAVQAAKRENELWFITIDLVKHLMDIVLLVIKPVGVASTFCYTLLITRVEILKRWVDFLKFCIISQHLSNCEIPRTRSNNCWVIVEEINWLHPSSELNAEKWPSEVNGWRSLSWQIELHAWNVTQIKTFRTLTHSREFE